MEKIKQILESEQGKDVITVIIIILVGFGSFGLGRLSKNGAAPGIQIEYKGEVMSPDKISTSQPASAISALKSTSNTEASLAGKNFFASNRGSKYYSAGCSAGKTIKMENRVYFTTSEEAEVAGYELSSSCK